MSTEALEAAQLGLLKDSGERDIIKFLARYPRVIESAAREREPHRIPFYLYDPASLFHTQHARGRDLPQLRFIEQDDKELTVARLALVRAVQLVISSGLLILGVEAPDEMR